MISGLPDDIDGDLYGGNGSSVLEPVQGVSILGPAYSGPIVGRDSIAVIGDRALKYVDDSRPVLMVVNRAEDASRLDGHHAHSKLAARHTVDFRAEVNSCKEAHRDAFRLRCDWLVAQGSLLSRSSLTSRLSELLVETCVATDEP